MNLFFELLQVAIGQREALSRNPSNEEWEWLYEQAKKQSLVGVALKALDQLPAELMPPKRVKLNWYLKAEKIAQRNAAMNQTSVRLVAALQKSGRRSCILKGQGNALMYPHPEMRIPGDIDIWIDADADDIIRLARKKLPGTKACYHHVDCGKVEGVEVEMHYRPSFMNSLVHDRRMQRWFLEQRDGQMQHWVELPGGVGEIVVPTVAFNRIFQMAHISNHVIHEGIGLRQLLDYYYLLKQGFTEQERQRDEQLLRKFGLRKVAGAVMYVMQQVFAMPTEMMIVEADERRGRFLLDEIMLAGNFGHYDERVEHGGGAWQKNMQRLRRDMRLLGYFPSECLWEPVFRWYHYFWRLRHG